MTVTVTDVAVLLVAMVVGLLIIVEVLLLVEIAGSPVTVSVVSEAVLVVLPVDLVPVLVPLCSAVEDGSLEVAVVHVAVDNAEDVLVVATSEVETVETVLVTVVALLVLEVVRVKV